MPGYDWEPTGRPGDFGPLGPWTLERTEYVGRCDTPVRCVPVLLDGSLIGYLWGSEREDAAGFFPRARLGTLGYDAGGRWRCRLREARDAGFAAWEAVQLWIGEPPDPVAGAVPADAEPVVLPDSRAAQRFAGGRYDRGPDR